MMPDVPVKDMLDRTISNLEKIDRLKENGAQVYEVTQLVNSFLAAFAHPWEEWREGLSSMSIDQAIREGWPMVEKSDPRDEDPETYGRVINFIRNGMAHGNIEFVNDGNDEILAVHVWNERGKWRTWGTRLDTNQLKQFLKCFQLLARTHEPSRKSPYKHIRDKPTGERTRCESCGRYGSIQQGQ